MTDVVLDYEITETAEINVASPFSGTLTFDSPIPGRLFVEFWAYQPDVIGLNKNKSIYHYVDWMLSSTASDAYAGIGPSAPSLNSLWEATVFINSPIVGADVTELDFSAAPSTPQDIIITNDGYATDLNITSLTADAPFGMIENCTDSSPIAALGTCTITVSVDDGSASIKGNNTLYASLGFLPLWEH